MTLSSRWIAKWRLLGREAMEEERPGLPLWGMVGAALAVVAVLGLVTLRFALREGRSLTA